MSDDRDDDDDDVGYGKPPKKHRFKPGQTGNPRGRPEKSKSLQNLMDRELDLVVAMKENGRELRLTKREVIVKRHVNSAMTGSARAIEHLIKYCNEHGVGDPFEITAEDAATFKAAVRRLAKKKEDLEDDCGGGGEVEGGGEGDNDENKGGGDEQT